MAISKKFKLRKQPDWINIKHNKIFPMLEENIGLKGTQWSSSIDFKTNDITIYIKRYEPMKHDSTINELILTYG